MISYTYLPSLGTPSREDCSLQQPRRGVVHVGYACNSKCKFCYYGKSTHLPFTATNLLEQRLDTLYQYGIREVEFTGGEPTLHPNILHLIRYAKSIGYTKVAIITNGTAISSVNTLRRFKYAGLDEFLFSVHAYDGESYYFTQHSNPDYRMNLVPYKETFSSISKSIQLASSLGFIIRVNTVVSPFNYKNLFQTVSNVVSWTDNRLFAVNFLPVNPWDDATDDYFVEYSLYEKELENACNYLVDNGVRVAIRYVPFCAFPNSNLQRFIYGQYQHIYDPYDWNREAQLVGYGDKPTLLQDCNGNFLPYGTNAYSAAGSSREALFKKPLECVDCRNFLICDGLHKTDNYTKVRPQPGNLIKDVTYYLSSNRTNSKSVL